MTDAERALLIAVTKAVIAQTTLRHTGDDEALTRLLLAVVHDQPEPESAA